METYITKYGIFLILPNVQNLNFFRFLKDFPKIGTVRTTTAQVSGQAGC